MNGSAGAPESGDSIFRNLFKNLGRAGSVNNLSITVF